MSQREFGGEFLDYLSDNNKISSHCAEDSQYIAYIEEQLKLARKRPERMFIYVEGGLIQTIVADGCMDILVLDGDTDGIDGVHEYVDMAGDGFKARRAWEQHPDNKKSIVDWYFDQQKEAED